MKAHLFGSSKIKNPTDFLGNEIKAGDLLTWDFHDDHYKDRVEDWMKLAIFVVKEHKSGDGLCAVGINRDLYLHDFRFKYCEICLRE